MKPGREERYGADRARSAPLIGALLFALACGSPGPPSASLQADPPDAAAVPGRPGGRLVVALAGEPQTLNPVIVRDLSSRAVVHRMTADLVHIDRRSQRAAASLAESWTATDAGRRYTVKLRPGLRFSDGHPADADDVLFSFAVYLDETIASPERDLLLVGGKPPVLRKVDALTVEIELAEPYAAAERLFDGLAILPRHRLQAAYDAGRLAQAWSLGAAAAEIVGLGPFRLREYQPGERLVLERNPYYWRRDSAGRQLPYLDEIIYLFVAKEAQTLRFLAGDIDVVDRLSPKDFAVLGQQAPRRGYRLEDLGAGLDVHFLFFNLNDLAAKGLPETARKQRWFRQLAFRQAVLAAIDLEGIVRLVFGDRATPLASHVTPGNRRWVDQALAPPTHSPEHGRQLLAGSGFAWDADGRLLDSQGQRVEFSLLTVASSPQTTGAATVIQDDLRQLGIGVQLVALELGAVAQRLFESFDYEACVLALGGGSGGPNPAMGLLLSSGSNHFWRLGQKPEAPWQAEIDRLMDRQRSTLDPRARQQLYNRVQQLVAEHLPLLALVSPNVLVAAKPGLGNFRPAILPHHTLWNAEELFWQATSN